MHETWYSVEIMRRGDDFWTQAWFSDGRGAMGAEDFETAKRLVEIMKGRTSEYQAVRLSRIVMTSEVVYTV